MTDTVDMKWPVLGDSDTINFLADSDQMLLNDAGHRKILNGKTTITSGRVLQLFILYQHFRIQVLD